MKYNFLFVFLITCSASYCQKIVDTIALYNGEMTKKKIEFDIKGNISKEIWFYKNGKIKAEYFYTEGNNWHWISYDKAGKIDSEWLDPEMDNAKWRKMRNWSFVSTGIIASLIVLAATRRNYNFTFFTILVLTSLVPLFILSIQKRISFGDHALWAFIFGACMVSLPVFLFILSIVNIWKKKNIPVIISIISFLISLGFFLFFIVAAGISGGGIIG